MSVRHALLALLSEGPSYGLQLQQEFGARTGEVWPLNVGQVYTTLQRLERSGLIESDSGHAPGPQRDYRITDTGMDELLAWLRPPEDTGVPPRDELVMKVLIAARIPDVDVVELITAHRLRLLAMMQHFTRVKSEADDDDVSLLVVADAEIYRLDAVIRWLDTTEARFRARRDGRYESVEPAPAPAAPARR